MKLATIFHRFGPYHTARLSAVARLSGCTLTGIELSAVDNTYAWAPMESDYSFNHVTLFRDCDIHEKSPKDVWQRMWQELADIKPHVVAVPGWSEAASLAAIAWCNTHKIPVVLMSASTAYDVPRTWWKECIKNRIVRLCSAALVGGSPQAEYLADIGMPRDLIFPGYDVVDNEYFATRTDLLGKNAKQLRSELDLPEHFFIVSNRFVAQKNLTRLLNAYAHYREKAGKKAWSLVLIGDGALRPQIEKQLADLNLTQGVLMPGFIQYDKLPEYYGLASVCILASVSETWGLVINEAMASGLPVIVSNHCGCAPDLVREGVNGFTFDPYDVDALADLMLKISSDACARRAMGKASREIISHWTPETFARNMIKAAQTAVKGPRTHSGFFDRALLRALANR